MRGYYENVSSEPLSLKSGCLSTMPLVDVDLLVLQSTQIFLPH